MKIEIDYYSTDDATVPIGTQGYFEGTLVCGHGRTAEEAKEQFIRKVSQILKTRNGLPGRETVEIPEPVEEPYDGRTGVRFILSDEPQPGKTE